MNQNRNPYDADCVYWVPSKRDDLTSLCEHFDVMQGQCDYWLKGGECKSDGLIHSSNQVPGDGVLLHSQGS